MESVENKQEEAETPKEAFKKPILIGKIGKLPKKISSQSGNNKTTDDKTEHLNTGDTNSNKEEVKGELKVEHVNQKPDVKERAAPAYLEPEWSGIPDETLKYGFEILKEGSIIGQQKLEDKSYWIFGRVPQCDISMAHPTISRYHAALQYRAVEAETVSASGEGKRGFYLYDLGSTHGTFLNKRRLKPNIFVRVQVGHMIKLGCSSRTYILTGPDEDREAESELSVTELKRKQNEELQKRLAAEEERRKELENAAEARRLAMEKRESEGVDWGMGEDADEETDLAENPYAQTNNEELYLDDPKKALRGFMEREGVELDYDCQEQGVGQFVCKVVLPLDDDRGRPLVAEVVHKGKKKEAVVQCALEACRILDRHGVLRQATHESKKRKAKNWEEDDYYDSDDDTFLDRTGSIEQKRAMRMNANKPQEAETYQSLVEKETKIASEIRRIEGQLAAARAQNQQSNDAEDSLDAFMADLKQPQLDKYKITQLRSELTKLKKEHAQVIKLVNIARPSNLPPLVPQYQQQSSSLPGKSKLPIFGKKIKVKVDKPMIKQPNSMPAESNQEDDDVEEKIPESAPREKSPVLPSDKIEEKASKFESIEDKIESTETHEDDETSKEMEAERRRKKNLRRIQQRLEKQDLVKQRGYEEDLHKEDYNMWVPPEGQSGDGKTSLNDKFGY